MASIWGPMGWITLHSVAAAYPEFPSNEIQVVTFQFLEKFAETITCRYCKDDFTRMFNTYHRIYPDFLTSRAKFFLFTLRAHNTVNKRLEKPMFTTVSECLESLRNATTNTSSVQFRLNYFSYIARNWMHELGGDGRIKYNLVNDMKKINNTFYSQDGSEFNNFFEEANVLELIQTEGTYRLSAPILKFLTAPGVGFKSGKLKLMR